MVQSSPQGDQQGIALHPQESHYHRYSKILRFYVGQSRRLPQRTLDRFARMLPSSLRKALVGSLERSGHVFEMDLDYIRPTVTRYRVESVVVAENQTFIVPPSGPIDRPDGHYWNQLRVHRLRNVVVDPTTGLVFAGNKVVSQSSYGWRSAADGAFLSTASTRARRAHRASPIEGPIAPFAGAVFNYYHFLIETLPRILHIRSVEPAAVVTLTEPIAGHVQKILSELEIPYRAIAPHAFEHDEVMLCDPSPHPWPHPDNIRILRDLAIDGSLPDSHYPERIYVSRIGSPRELIGEHDLEVFLQDHGYVSVRMELLPWAEQVGHFRRARSVVAAHGAGLATTAFMTPGSEVFELTTGVVWFPSMRNVSTMAGAQHHLVPMKYRPELPHGTARDAISAMEAVFLHHQT